MRFKFKPGVLDVLKKQIKDGVPAKSIALSIGVYVPTLNNVLTGGSMQLLTAVKFIKYFQKYYHWSKDEWREKLVEL